MDKSSLSPLHVRVCVPVYRDDNGCGHISNGAEEEQEGLTCVRGVTPTDIISTECVL